MGKYMKKSKITGDVAVMEVSQQTSLGVRTRAAKTLALQRLNSASAPPSTEIDTSSFSYLQLRNRRLEKPSALCEIKKPAKENCKAAPRSGSRVQVESGLALKSLNKGKMEGGQKLNDLGFVEASFGENNLDGEARDRSARENTPPNIPRDSDTKTTPGSTTRQRSPAMMRNEMLKSIPTPDEIEEFFAHTEQQQQKLFREKYNFDINTEQPLPGRYEWVRVCP